MGREPELTSGPRGPRPGILDAPVVELRQISRTYGSDPPVHALRGVDLVVERGDAIAIVGP